MDAPTTAPVPTFDAFYQAHSPLIYRRAYALLGQREEAEDVTQEAFVKLFRTYPRLHESPRGYACLYRIATNAALDVLRRRRCVAFHSLDALEVDVPDTTQRDPQDDYELDERVLHALQALPEEKRQVLLLYRLGGYSIADIAAHYGRSRRWATVYLHRIGRAFQQHYQAVQP